MVQRALRIRDYDGPFRTCIAGQPRFPDVPATPQRRSAGCGSCCACGGRGFVRSIGSDCDAHHHVYGCHVGVLGAADLRVVDLYLRCL